MTLAAGAKLGPYEISASIGAGGMGEVYRARDARLSRDVAVKVLGSAFAVDSDRLRRFEQEARATGLLNHPNILQVFDTGTHEGAPYVVSELLEGETLRDRIGSTPLPVRKAIDYATQVAKGLSAAHDKGIVHRDLKPENLFLTKDGRVKILDFGLAKLVDGEALVDAETNTRGMPGTDAGKVLGTVGYMSPEQVRGQVVDHRSDIFAFGSVLYEMLSGKRAFRGPSTVETLNAILKEDPPPLSETNRSLPPALERIVGHCLEKNPEERFQSARDIAFDLEQLSGTSQTAGVAPLSGARRTRIGLPLLIAVALVATGLGLLAGRRGERPKVPSFERVTFRREAVPVARFAPDGRTVVFESFAGGPVSELLTAQIGSPESRRLDVKDARLCGVSSKGELAVLLRRKPEGARTLARMPLSGGAPRDVADDVDEADWGPDGSSLAILRFTGTLQSIEFPPGKSLYQAPSLTRMRISPTGDRIAFNEHPIFGDNRGDVVVVDLQGKKTVLSSGWADLGSLAWSPDGREIYFSATNEGPEHSVHAVDLEGHERLVYRLPGSVDVRDVDAKGHLLLSVQHGQPRILGRGPGDTAERDLSWLDYSIVQEVSRDGKTVLFEEDGLGGGAEYATYIRGMDGSAPVRLGSGTARRMSPDGKWVFVITVDAPVHAVLLPTGTGEPRPLPRGTLAQLHFGDFTSDGKHVILIANEPGRDLRMWLQDIAGGDPKALTAEGRVGLPTPDGKFAAIYTKAGYELQPLPEGPARPIVGVAPTEDLIRFTADGRALIIRARSDQPARLFKVDVATGQRVPFKELGPSEAMTGRVGNLDITDDGRAYVYNHRDIVHTLYVADGLR